MEREATQTSRGSVNRNPAQARARLGAVGGCGGWWIVDIIRIGSAPVLAQRYRLAADLREQRHERASEDAHDH